MNSILPIARYCACAGAAAACAAVLAMHPPFEPELPDLSNAQLEAAYLDCARISAGSLLEPDLVTVCSMVARALLQRRFGGDLERQLQWWRKARASAGATSTASAAQAPAPCPGADAGTAPARC